VIEKPSEHETNRAGKRLLRDVLEPLGWVVNDVQEDYGIDCNVQVFDKACPTGAWFHVQLKSSICSAYSADLTFLSQELSVDHARHYALEMRGPVIVVHVDVQSRSVFWYAPQLDRRLSVSLYGTDSKSTTVRIPANQRLPETAPALLDTLERIHLLLANRELTSASVRSFAESLDHMPDQATLYRAFQEKPDTLKLHNIRRLYDQSEFTEAKSRAEVLLCDPDSTIEIKFWAEIQLRAIDYRQTVHSGKPQTELPKVLLAHAKDLQKLTATGPKHLKFYSLIARHAAELDVLVHENSNIFMALHQHLHQDGNPMMALGLYARRSALSRQIISNYNRCLRLARYATTYPDRWVLGRALAEIVTPLGMYLTTLRSEKHFEAERAFADSALQICKLAVWICQETEDDEGIVLAIIDSLLTTRSVDSDAYRWADQAAQSIPDPDVRADAIGCMERAVKRWQGEKVDGDYHGDTIWQIIQNISTALRIDLSNENDPLVRSLRIAAKDNSPERVLATCEHIVATQGAVGPNARLIRNLFNVDTAGSKVVHCTLHDWHKEGRELDAAFKEFKVSYCDSCPEKKPRPEQWQYTDEARREIETRHGEYVARLQGTPHGPRFTLTD